MELRRKRTMSSCVNQQYSRPLQCVESKENGLLGNFFLANVLLWFCIGITRFWVPSRMQSIASNKLNNSESDNKQRSEYRKYNKC